MIVRPVPEDYNDSRAKRYLHIAQEREVRYTFTVQSVKKKGTGKGMEKVRYMISDAANIVNVESHVLRYWEDELELDIPRNEMGHRYYTKENIREFQRIKELKEQGYQLKAIRMIVHNLPVEEPGSGAEVPQPAPMVFPGTPADAPQIPLESVPAEMPPQPGSEKPVESGMVQRMSAVVMPPAAESRQSILENTDKMAQFTELMTQIVGKAIAANNGELSRNISEDVGEHVIKEMNYLMREREEAEEERFRKLDAAIRGNLKKKEPHAKKWQKKKPSQT
jgi:DNA-binding transcriptional MerR regulator